LSQNNKHFIYTGVIFFTGQSPALHTVQSLESIFFLTTYETKRGLVMDGPFFKMPDF